MKKLYLAYGSNMNKEAMAKRCPQAQAIGVSHIADHELFFAGDKKAYLSIRPKKGESVPVAIWEITPDCELALDEYEAYPNMYGKEMINIPFQDDSLEAMVYIMAAPFAQHEFYPDQTYIDVVEQGFKDFGIDPQYLETALEKARLAK